MTIDDDLRRLFTDDRLDVPVHAGATAAVVAGARRRRRRTATLGTGGALATALVIAGGVALGGGGTPPVPPASPPTSAVSTPKPAAPILGPYGFQGLKLGMPYAEAVETGLLVAGSPPGPEGCSGYDLTAYPNASNEVSAYVMPDLGVAAIFLQPGMRTPEGVTLGAPVADFYAAYPGAEPAEGQSVVAVPGNPKAIYHMLESPDGKVESLALALSDHQCFG
ncbi:hypothetical protein GCM10023148_03140 [Actinokineospora soli]